MKWLYILVLSVFAGSACADPAYWKQSISIDDFDDTKTIVNMLVAKGQGSLYVRYHESKPQDYEVIWTLPDVGFMTCGDSGDWMDHSGWSNIQVRVDGGAILSLTGSPSTDKQSAFLKSGHDDSLGDFVKSLTQAEKIVMRVKDKCHENGASWVFSKLENISGNLDLSELNL